MIGNRRYIFLGFVFIIYHLSSFSFLRAATIRFVEAQDGVSVVMDTENEEINGVEGTMRVGAGAPLLVLDSGSIVNFWIIRPTLSSDGVIRFSGIVAGGIVGPSMPLFALRLSETPAKDIEVVFDGGRATISDGSGTVRAIPAASYRLHDAGEIEAPTDRNPPEPFVPASARHESIFEGQWFLSFATHDKSTGMSHFEIQESGAGTPIPDQFRRVESPYVLKDQSRRSFVFVKAVDTIGNERIAVVPPAVGPAKYTGKGIWYILLAVGAIGLCLLMVWKKRKKAFL